GGLEIDVSVVDGLGDDMKVVLNGLAEAGIEQVEFGAGVDGAGAGKLADVSADVLVAEVHSLHGRRVAAFFVLLDVRANAEHCFEFFHRDDLSKRKYFDPANKGLTKTDPANKGLSLSPTQAQNQA